MSKTALVTGGALRVGREICLALAHDGWNVVIHYRRSAAAAEELAQIIRAQGRKAHLLQCDLKEEKQVAAMFPTLAGQGVVVDALINNASLFEKDSIATLSRESWDAHLHVNALAPMLLIKAFTAQYKGTQGNVINITDGLRGWSMSPAFLSYTLSKMALANATELLARTFAPSIRINAIAPGPVLEGVQDKSDTFEKLRSIIPLNNTGTPADVVQAVRYVLSASLVTGQTILLSGGIHTPAQWGM